MNEELRCPVIAGNWKMNKNPSETKDFIKRIIDVVNNNKVKVILCVPFIDLPEALISAKNSKVLIGAQNCHFEKNGAFTGEISPSMLKSMGVEYVIIGHSERRNYFNEDDKIVNKKVKAALESGLSVILCVGESLEQRELNVTSEVISSQIKRGLYEVDKSDMKRVIIAYEPIWAIGTGRTASPNAANEVCSLIRKIIGDLYDIETSEHLIIQYGGSMNSKNAKDLLSMHNIDGGLIGSSSLDSDEFLDIIATAKS